MSKRYSKKKEAMLNSIPIFLSKAYQIVDVSSSVAQNPEYGEIITWGEDQ